MSDAWDRELDVENYKKLSPARKSVRARVSLERKVTILEEWARRGVPDGAEVCHTRPRLRSWSVPEHRLWCWADPDIDHPGKRNSDLVARFIRAVAVIRKATTDVSGRTDELEASKKANRRLLEQNAELFAEVLARRKREAAGPTRLLR